MSIELRGGGLLSEAMDVPLSSLADTISEIQHFFLLPEGPRCSLQGPYEFFTPGELLILKRASGRYTCDWSEMPEFDAAAYHAYFGDDAKPSKWKIYSRVQDYIREAPKRVQTVLNRMGVFEASLIRIGKILNQEKVLMDFVESDMWEELERLASLYTMVPELGEGEKFPSIKDERLTAEKRAFGVIL
jgi:hypothetical protein